MRDSNNKVIYLQWVVITVLILGAAAGGYMIVNKADQLQESNDELSNKNASLNRQLEQAQQTPSPSASATPSPSLSPSQSASPRPTASPH